MPKFFPGTNFVTSFIISETSLGNVPPLVSQSTIHLAPLSYADLMQDLICKKNKENY